MIYGIEISGNDARIIKIEGTLENYQISIVTPKLSLLSNDDSIEAIIDFQHNFEMLIQNEKPNLVVLCEGGQDSKRKRIRMEFAVLYACNKNSIKYKTYASNATSRFINSGFKKITGKDFSDFFKTLQIPAYYKKAVASAWRYFGQDH